MVRHSRSGSIMLFWLCFAAYTSAYCGRLNYSAAIAAITDSGALTKSAAGIASTVFFFVYGACQLLMGLLADRFPARKMLSIGVSGSFLVNLTMAMVPASAIPFVWGFNGLFQSMLWAPILSIIAGEIRPEMRDFAAVAIAPSCPVGTLLAYLISATTVSTSWRLSFLIPAILLGVFGFLMIAGFRYLERRHPAEDDEEGAAPEAKTSAAAPVKAVRIAPLLVTSGVVCMIVPIMLHGMLKEGIATWVPTMITETYTMAPSFSILISTVLPVVNLSGVFVAMWIFRHIAREHEIVGATIMMTAALIPLTVLLFIGRIPAFVAVILLACVTSLMHGFNQLTMTLVPMRFGRLGRTASVAGILNCTTYAGCAISGYGFGALAETFGWQNTVKFWIGIALASALLCLTAIRRWKRFTAEK